MEDSRSNLGLESSLGSSRSALILSGMMMNSGLRMLSKSDGSGLGLREKGFGEETFLKK
jgi:hypothetical protein